MAGKNKKIIIKGVGAMMAKIPGGNEIVTLGSLQNLRFDFTAEDEPIYGGDGLFPIDTLLKEKRIAVSATDAKFDLSNLTLVSGSSVGQAVGADAYLWALNEKISVGGTSGVYESYNIVPTKTADDDGNITIAVDGTDIVVAILDTDTLTGLATKIANAISSNPTIGAQWTILRSGTVVKVTAKTLGNKGDVTFTDTGVTGAVVAIDKLYEGAAGASNEAAVNYGSTIHATPEFQVRDDDTGALLTEITVGSPAIGQFRWDAGTQRIIFNANMAGKIVVVNYKRVDTNVVMAALLKNDVPVPVSIVHQGAFQQKDGTWQGIETELFLCRAQGTYTMDFARGTASANTLTFEILDPERTDCRLGTIKRYAIDTPPCM
jgi:hypothetical protein